MNKLLMILTIIFSGIIQSMEIPESKRGKEAYEQLLGLNNALLEAAQKGDFQGIEKALKAGANVDAKNRDGQTALSIIFSKIYYFSNKSQNPNDEIYNHLLKILDYLIDKGANVNIRIPWGSLLWFAIVTNDPKKVKLLIEHKVDVDAVSLQGNSVLLLLLGKIKAGLTDEQRKNKIEIIKLLLKAGASTTIKNKQGYTINDFLAANSEAAKIFNEARFDLDL